MSAQQLLDILKANAAEQAYWRTAPPRACPNDGTPLEAGPRGELHCPMGDYEYPRDWVAPC